MDDGFTRKRNRLRHYDYSQPGSYFLTICSREREKLFRDDNNSSLTHIGEIVEMHMLEIPKVYPGTAIEDYVIMPNHIHMILTIWSEMVPGISEIVRQFKGTVTKEACCKVFQKSFYDHVIRNDKDLYRIREYIMQNPKKWEVDQYYSDK